MTDNTSNIDQSVVAGFGDEWSRFPQSAVEETELAELYDCYFHIFPWEKLSEDAQGADVGCGSGRWASFVANHVHHLHAVDPSPDALEVAKQHCQNHQNMTFHQAGVDSLPFEDESLDFAYSLGVLHHVPDTASAIQSVAKKMKPGAPFLIYLYYSFDNRPAHYIAMWKLSETLRAIVSKLPHSFRYFLSQVLAGTLYFPLARASWLASKLGIDTDNWPLSFYGDKSFYTMRTDALDRFGTSLEQRFSKIEITEMLVKAGFTQISFSDREPYWCAICYKG